MDKREAKERRRDPVSSFVGATFLMWLGVVLLAVNVGFLNVFTNILATLAIGSYELPFEVPFLSPEAWQVFFLGGGAILLIEVVLRLLVPAYRRAVLGSLLGAVVFFALALGNWQLVGPLVLVAVGVALLTRGLLRKR